MAMKLYCNDEYDIQMYKTAVSKRSFYRQEDHCSGEIYDYNCLYFNKVSIR